MVAMQLEPIGPNIWVAIGTEIKFMGLLLGTRSTIVRLNDGSVWMHSPVSYNSDLATEIENLGPVRYLVAPNVYHHFFLKEWQDHYPDAELIGPRDLPAKRPDLTFSALFDDLRGDPWPGEIDRVVFTGSRAFDEHVFFHRASRTAILTDLIVNVRLDNQSTLGRLIAHLEGVAHPNGRTPLLYRLGMRDRAAGANAVAAILGWGATQAVISHGEWFREDATQELRKRFAWLPL
jgi:Domain of unknown function (DUF4336)